MIKVLLLQIYFSIMHVRLKSNVIMDRNDSPGGDLYSAVAVAATRRLLWPKETWFCGAALLLLLLPLS